MRLEDLRDRLQVLQHRPAAGALPDLQGGEGRDRPTESGRVEPGREARDDAALAQLVQPALHRAARDPEDARGPEHADVGIVLEQGEQPGVQVVDDSRHGHSVQYARADPHPPAHSAQRLGSRLPRVSRRDTLAP